MQERLLRHYERMEAALIKLRPVLVKNNLPDAAAGYLQLFDDLIEHAEYGLALDTICDFVLEPDYTPLRAELVDELISLHLAMEMDDDCGMKLKAKLQNST